MVPGILAEFTEQLRDSVELAAVPRRSFDHRCLRPKEDLEAMLGNNSGDDPRAEGGVQSGLAEILKALRPERVIKVTANGESWAAPGIQVVRTLPPPGSEFDAIVLAEGSSARAIYDQVARGLAMLRWGGVLVLTDYRRVTRPLQRQSGSPQFRALARVQRENRRIAVVEPGFSGIAVLARRP